MKINYNKQVDTKHYVKSYDTKQRFISYFNQVAIINDLAAEKAEKKNVDLLEVGPGTGFIRKYYSDSTRVNYFSSDIDKDLKPDFVSSVTELSAVITKKFDVVCIFEVLEHIDFQDIDLALLELSRISKKYVIISIPQVRLYANFWIKLSKINALAFGLSIPLPLRHVFDGQHYWELGKRGYPRSLFRDKLKNVFIVKSEFTDPLSPYHRFFVCQKKDQ